MDDDGDQTPAGELAADLVEWGLRFPTTLAMASRVLRLPTERLGDLFFEGWRAPGRAGMLLGPSDLMLVEIVTRLLNLAGIDLRDPSVTCQPDSDALERLKEYISGAWHARQSLQVPSELLLLAGPERAPERDDQRAESVVVDLDLIAVHLQRRIARETVNTPVDPFGWELYEWLADARRCVDRARVMMQEASQDLGVILTAAGPVDVRGDLDQVVSEAVGVLDDALARVAAIHEAASRSVGDDVDRS